MTEPSVRISSWQLHDEEQSGVVGDDVTERLASDQRLAAAEEKYRWLVENNPDAIWTCNASGSLVFITANVQRILGFSAEEMCQEDLETRSARLHPEDRESVRNAFEAFVQGGTSFDLEYRRQRKDGSWAWVRIRSTAAYERDGERRIDGTMSDIGERKRLEESHRQAQRLEALGQFTGGIAHDFNNILLAILGSSHFLIEQLAENDPRRTDAEDIRVAAERAAALTRQLLAFSRSQVLEARVVDVNPIILALVKMLQRLIGEDIELSVSTDPTLGRARLDVAQFEQVVMNLVVNARDAMPDGGSLAIETGNADLDASTASRLGAAAGQYVVLTVKDTGCGMSTETRRHIFEPFFTTKALGKGTGLGLSTCYGIVKQSGGTIVVHSEPGLGSTFRIYFPRVDEPPEHQRSVPVSRTAGGKETVLLIEDDGGLRKLVSRMLEERGYRVKVARSGAHAMEIAERDGSAIDLVLTDVVMPGASGPHVVKELRSRCPQSRVLFMSGYTDHAIFQKEAMGPGNFIQKPFSPDGLARKVREVLGAYTGDRSG